MLLGRHWVDAGINLVLAQCGTHINMATTLASVHQYYQVNARIRKVGARGQPLVRILGQSLAWLRMAPLESKLSRFF